MCLEVGCEATVYQPMNSSEGKTCLSVGSLSDTSRRQKPDTHTLILSYIERSVIDLAVALLYGDFESVDDLDLTAILSAKKSTKNCIRNETRKLSDLNKCAPKGRLWEVWSLRRVRCSEIFRIGRG